jgi:hypothetical protein
MFAGKARWLPLRGAPNNTSIDFGLTNKHLTKLESPARFKHSSLFGPFSSYNEKSFKTPTPGIKVIKLYFLITYRSSN